MHNPITIVTKMSGYKELTVLHEPTGVQLRFTLAPRDVASFLSSLDDVVDMNLVIPVEIVNANSTSSEAVSGVSSYLS